MNITRFKIFLKTVLLSILLFSCSTQKQSKEPVDYVNQYIGSISHTLHPVYPAVHLPNSMLRLIPSRTEYTTDKLKGLPVFTPGHRAKPAFCLSPISGDSLNLECIYFYSYDNEKITPYSWDIYLDEQEIEVSYSVSHQSGIYYMNFADNHSKYLLLNSNKGSLNVDKGIIEGFQEIKNKGTNKISDVYIYLETDIEPSHYGVLEKGQISELKSASGKDACIALEFDKTVKQIKVKYGISLISAEQAKKNLYREITDFNKDAIAETGRKLWNQALGKISVEGGSEDDRTVFYTSLYRTYERPVCISEDGYYYSGFDDKVHADSGNSFYVDDWIWDTYRAAHPLRCLTEKEMQLNIIKSYVRAAEQMENLWMPTFPEVTGDSRRMNSNHGVAVVLDAYNKGLTDFDLNIAYIACKKAITEKTLAPWSFKPAGKLDEFYKENGYFPALRENQKETIPEVFLREGRQPVAVTLGTVYDEWCLSQLAQILEREDEYNYFFNRSYNYRKIYNSKTGFFHPKDDKNEFIMPFDYRFSGGKGARQYYGENNGWIYRWDVQHNVADLIELMGGNEQFINNLEATFNEPLGKSKFDFQAQLPNQTATVGQFSIANEPAFHIPYLYNYASQPWKTQKRIRKLLFEWFGNDMMGMPGDEDGGGMSAFIVFSKLGFYPVTPGIAVYNIGSPIFEKSIVNLGNEKYFIINAENVSEQNKYIQSAKLNGKDWNQPWFSHEEIKDGGELTLIMGPKANKNWGVGKDKAPPSAKRPELH